jgi:metal-dependent amidase/aminoacylase/carboxypeptidase family protein
MKAGNVVALELFNDTALLARSPYKVAVVLYAGEEGPADGNELPLLLERHPWLATAALAIVMEPTDSQIQLGCLGGLHAELVFDGVAAHSARPWDGDNAIYNAHQVLSELANDHVRPVTVDGIAFSDVWSVTRAYSAGFGPDVTVKPPVRNVIPDRFTLNLNFRFAPNRSLEQAETELRERIGTRAHVTIVDRAPPAPHAAAAERARAMVAILLHHPALLPDVEEAFATLDLQAGLAQLRDAILQWSQTTEMLDSAALMSHLTHSGLAAEAALALSAVPVPLPGCADADAMPAEAGAGWWHYFGLMNPGRLDEEVEAARAAFAAQADEAAQRRLILLTATRAALLRGEAGEADAT